MTQKDFIAHACEQVLRFTKVEEWGDLSEEIKVKIGFNMGVMALGLNLTKEDGFLILTNARLGKVSMKEFREQVRKIVSSHTVKVDDAKIARRF